MDKRGPQLDYWNWASQFWQKGMELNYRLWRDAMEGFYGTRPSSGQMSAASVEDSARTLLKAYEAYVQLTLRYAEDVVKLGLDVSKEMNQAFGRTTSARKEEARSDTRPANQEAYVIRLAARAGEAIKTSFSLESGESASRSGKMQAGDFIRQDTGAKGRMKVGFDPESFTLMPGESQTIEMTISTPKNQAQGLYRSSVSVEGFDDAQFDVLLEISPARKSGKSTTKGRGDKSK